MRELLMFLGVICTIIIILFLAIIVLAVYSCCVVASKCSRHEDKEYKDLQDKSDVLSDFEKQTFNELKEELLKDINK